MDETAAPKLTRAFYRRDPVTVARELLGQRLVHIAGGQRIAGLIVETEAYLGVKDRGSFFWRTPNGTYRNHVCRWRDGLCLSQLRHP